MFGNDSEIPEAPRGSGFETADGFRTRTETEYNIDVHADYAFRLAGRRRITAVLDIFNLFDLDRVIAYDNRTELGSGGFLRRCAMTQRGRRLQRWLIVSALAASSGAMLGRAQVQPAPPFDKSGEITVPEMAGISETDLSGGGFSGTGPPPRVSTNVRVNDAQRFFPDGLIGRSETSIVASRNAQGLVAGWNDADGFCALGTDCTVTQLGLTGFAFSADGGKSWTDGGAPPLFDDIFTFGDPWLDRGGADKDTIYLSSIGSDLGTGQFGMSIHRGRFSGPGQFAWEDVRFVTPGVTSGPGGGDFLDKEAIAAAKDGSGIVIMSLTNFLDLAARNQCPEASAIGFGQIEVFRSTDGGDTYQGPTVVGPDLTDFAADANCNVGVGQQSSAPAFGPNGEVYVVWERGPRFDLTDISGEAEIVIATSLDGGATFGPPVVVDQINHMRGAPPVAYNRNRTNNHPRIAVASNGSQQGRVYVTYSSMVVPVSGVPESIPCPPAVPADRPCVAQNLTSSQAVLSYSDDQGATWSAPVPLAPSVPAEGVKRIWPTVSVGPGGIVEVVYYESLEAGLTPDPTDIECNQTLQGNVRRAGEAISLVDTYWVRSGDGGATFNTPVRVSEVSTNWCQVVSNIIPNMGDYIFSTSIGNRVLPVWADGRDGVPDTFYARGLGAGKSGN
ncbi:MAG: hypothetical protein GEV06_25615 [Luteitalea sp.]|nr:hypothetical protein [Luteitalea sp.]